MHVIEQKTSPDKPCYNNVIFVGNFISPALNDQQLWNNIKVGNKLYFNKMYGKYFKLSQNYSENF